MQNHRTERECAQCATKFLVAPSHVGVTKYCTPACRKKASRARVGHGPTYRSRHQAKPVGSRDRWGIPSIAAPRVDLNTLRVLFRAHFVDGLSPEAAWEVSGGTRACSLSDAKLWLAHPEVFHPYIDEVIDLRLRMGDASAFRSMTVWEREDFLARYQAGNSVRPVAPRATAPLLYDTTIQLTPWQKDKYHSRVGHGHFRGRKVGTFSWDGAYGDLLAAYPGLREHLNGFRSRRVAASA